MFNNSEFFLRVSEKNPFTILELLNFFSIFLALVKLDLKFS